MSKQKVRVEVQILGNNYSLMCDAYSRNLFLEAAEQLNDLLNNMRQDNPRNSLEKTLAMAGLQLSFDLLQERQTLAKEVSTVNQVSARLLSALDMALQEVKNNSASLPE